MTSSHWRLLLSVTVPALVALIAGLTHPLHLSPATAEYWRNLHLALLPIFPLIGAAPWLLARHRRGGWIAVVAAIGGYAFAICYTALDILAGIAGGTLVLNGNADATGPVFRIGDTLAAIGVAGLVVAMVAATVATVRETGVPAVIGGLLGVVGAALILPGHVWFPIGTLALALFIAGSIVLTTAQALGASTAPPKRRARLA